MSRARRLSETVFQEVYQSSSLPPFWEVVYQEGIRGHHFLFSPSELAEFSASGALDVPETEASEAEFLEETALSILSRPDASSVRSLIASLSIRQKKHLFVLYQRALTLWAFHLKTVLN